MDRNDGLWRLEASGRLLVPPAQDNEVATEAVPSADDGHEVSLLVDGRVLPRRMLMAAVKTAPQKSDKKTQTQASGQAPAASTASRS